VTLNYNHDYGGALTAINEILAKFAEAKMHIYRQAEGTGGVAVRPLNWSLSKRVFRADRGFAGIVPNDTNLYSCIGI
jgi:hypothetical protein